MPIDKIIERYNRGQKKLKAVLSLNKQSVHFFKYIAALCDILEKKPLFYLPIPDFLNPLREPELGLYKTLIGDEMVCPKCGKSDFKDVAKLFIMALDFNWMCVHCQGIMEKGEMISKHKLIALEAVKIYFDESLSDEERLNKAINLIEENMK